MCPHCTSQPSSFSFIAKQTIASILRLLYTSQNYMMPFQTILYYYHLLYNILFFNIIGSSPFPPYCSKDQRVDQTRQAAVSLFLLLCTRTYIYIWLYSDYSSNSCTILALSPYYSPDQKGKRPPFSCYASIYSPARWALDGPTLTDNNQCYTTRNHKYFADKWLDID